MTVFPTQDAVLVMESNGFAASVRHTTFTKRWSRLYQAGLYFIDVTLQPDGTGSLLQGQVLHQDGAPLPDDAAVALDGEPGGTRIPIGSDGDFAFRFDTASARTLQAELNGETFLLRELDVS